MTKYVPLAYLQFFPSPSVICLIQWSQEAVRGLSGLNILTLLDTDLQIVPPAETVLPTAERASSRKLPAAS